MLLMQCHKQYFGKSEIWWENEKFFSNLRVSIWFFSSETASVFLVQTAEWKSKLSLERCSKSFNPNLIFRRPVSLSYFFSPNLTYSWVSPKGPCLSMARQSGVLPRARPFPVNPTTFQPPPLSPSVRAPAQPIELCRSRLGAQHRSMSSSSLALALANLELSRWHEMTDGAFVLSSAPEPLGVLRKGRDLWPLRKQQRRRVTFFLFARIDSQPQSKW